jgi:hypothetical protein
MKLRVIPISRLFLPATTLLLGVSLMAVAAGGKTNTASKAKTGNSGPAVSAVAEEQEPAAVKATIPQSIFLIPATEKEGKDPFFPRSKRLFVTPVVTVATNPVVTLGDLTIAGISSGEKPLVIINNVTFGVGDTAEIISGGRRISIQCLEIDLANGSAKIQHSGGEERVLNFQKLVK